MSDDDLKAQQDEVSRLIGRCLLRLQQYEGQLKAILAHHDLSAGPEGLEAVLADCGAGLSRQTLGKLIEKLSGSVLVAGEPGEVVDRDGPDATEGAPTVWVTLRLGLTEEEQIRTEADLRDLLGLRNDLVHHFMARHDLWSVDGCRVAQAELAVSCDRIGRHLERLREWAADMDRARQEAVEHLRSDTFQNLAIHGILPDGTVDWPASSLVSGFREAAQALAGAGESWVSVAEAGKWLVQKYPDQTPERFGCRTWQHALQESRLFDLRHRATADGCVLCFRARRTSSGDRTAEQTWRLGDGGAVPSRT
ncbi:MAG: OST-HTH/LOTUS domain-containing protein [Tabrizicola flagellatus]|uniref:OST-HTH/LOTUS domain-containing protein n=1 Tax=Tabrizicola flagellatus TaxID=2593021 RepID=UPI00391E0054